ncbi:MAG: L-fuconolactonase [Crocinitomicaceae bacterium]|jgi:L-fuconolactonase
MAIDQPFEKQEAWINQVVEAALEPELPICDAHHHFWNGTGHTGWPCLLEDLQRNTGAGHNIEQTVFLECHAEYKKDGPKHMRSVGEVEFVSALAEASATVPGATVAAIRYSTAQDVHPPLKQPTSAPMDDANYLQGVRRVGADYSAADKTNLFHDTAARAYRMPTISNV